MNRKAINDLLCLWGVRQPKDRILLMDAIHYYIYPERIDRQPKAREIYAQIAEYSNSSVESIERRMQRILRTLGESEEPTVRALFDSMEKPTLAAVPFLRAFYEMYIMPGDLVRALWKVADQAEKGQKKRAAR